MAFTSTLPLVLRGAVDAPNTALSAGAGRGRVDARQAELIASMYLGTALATPVNEGFATRDEKAGTLQGEMEAASRNALSIQPRWRPTSPTIYLIAAQACSCSAAGYFSQNLPGTTR